MYRKVYVPDEEVGFDYLSEPLNFNKMPKPFREISIDEYFKQLNTWHFTYDGFFQIKNDEARSVVGNDMLTEVFCCFNEDSGYARAMDAATNRLAPNISKFQKKMRRD